MDSRLNVPLSAELSKLLAQPRWGHRAGDRFAMMLPVLVAGVVKQIRPPWPPFIDQPQVAQDRLAPSPLGRMPGVGVQEHHVRSEQERTLFLDDPQEVAAGHDLSRTMLHHEPPGERGFGTVVDCKRRDPEIAEFDCPGRLERPKFATFSQMRVDAVRPGLPALPTGEDRKRANWKRCYSR